MLKLSQESLNRPLDGLNSLTSYTTKNDSTSKISNPAANTPIYTQAAGKTGFLTIYAISSTPHPNNR